MLSLDAEDAVFQVNITQSIVPKEPRRWRRRRRRSSIQRRVLSELAVGRIVAAGEAYLVMRATRELKPDLLEEIPPPRPPDSVTERLQNAARNFGVVRQVWKDDLKVDLESLGSLFTDFTDLRELRHVLVHRLGYWQPGLDPKEKLEDRVRTLGIDPDFYRGPIPLDADEVQRSVRIALTLVAEADARLA